MHLRPGTRRQADQSNFVALLRQGLGTHLHILPDGAATSKVPIVAQRPIECLCPAPLTVADGLCPATLTVADGTLTFRTTETLLALGPP